MAVKEKKIIFFQDVTATLGDGLAWIAPFIHLIHIRMAAQTSDIFNLELKVK